MCRCPVFVRLEIHSSYACACGVSRGKSNCASEMSITTPDEWHQLYAQGMEDLQVGVVVIDEIYLLETGYAS